MSSIVKNKQNKFYRWHVISDLMPAGKSIKGAEIGVWKGECSRHLLQMMPKLHLYMIDPWELPPPDSDYYASGDSKAITTQGDHDSAYRQALKVAEQYHNRTTIITGKSVEVAKFFPDLLDFVFIDGDHTEEAAYNDIMAWLPHVKPGGIVAGHDYGLYGVEPAVKRALGYKFHISHDTVWWHRKQRK